MIEVILYLGKSLLLGALFFFSYQFLMRKESYLVLNRIYLLTAAVLTAILPLAGSFVKEGIRLWNQPAEIMVINLPEVVISATKLVNQEQQQAILNWAAIGYGLITLAMLGGLILGIIRIYRFYRLSMNARKLNDNVYLVSETGSPFSFLGKIYISGAYEKHPGLPNIILHENAHIRQGHMMDLILLEVLSSIFWFNPFIFLFKRAMREVHEYLADREVIRQGVEPLSYQQLLFNEVSGSPEYIIANNFNLLTKKRIIMLIKKSSRSAAVRIGVLLPLIVSAALVLSLLQSGDALAQTTDPKPAQVAPAPPSQPAVAEPQSKPAPPAPPAKTEKKNIKEATDDQDKPVFVVVENQPEYNGGQEAMMKYLVGAVKYPEEARKKGIQGPVYISFIVNEDGSISNVKCLRGIGGGCDEEAIRVVKGMPNWIPGTQKGKAVRVQFNLPIKFTLSNEKSKNPTN
ncbi:MAG: TonB family protein [Bacteroidales bacterium]|nr:TonB family protein [Bacteroidales bacterium]